MKTNAKQFSVVVTALTVLLGTMMAPALADEPTQVIVDPAVFSDVDPCTGNDHVITIFFDVFLHEDHNNMFVGYVVRSGFTDSGYEMFAGREHFVNNHHAINSWFRDAWRNDDGRMFEVSARFVMNLNQNKVTVDKFVFRCITGDTTL